jgi:death-on-curing protein
MIRSVSIAEVLETYQRIMQQTGGLIAIRDFGAFKSARAQPYVTFDGNELYPSLAEKAAALGFSLIQNHPLCRRQQTHRSCGDGNVSCNQWL